MDIRKTLWIGLALLPALLVGCGSHESSEELSIAAGPPGFRVRAENPAALEVLSFMPQGSSLTCTAFFGTGIKYVRWVSALPPPADLTPIAIGANRNGRYDIYLVAPDGSWVKQLTGGGCQGLHPSWSPNGTKIAFARWPEPADIWIMNAAGRNRRPVTDLAEHAGAAAWHPSRARLAIRIGNDKIHNIFTTTIRGTAWRQLTNDSYFNRGPEWSPDGSQIVFVSNRTGNNDIFRMDADGQNVTQLTTHPKADMAPAWSPAGNKIVYSNYQEGSSDLYVMNVDGSNVQRITDSPGKDAHADWSPDAQKICCRYDHESHSYLRLMNADGTGAQTVLGPPYEIQCTAWIIRGSKRVFVGRAGTDAGFDPPLGSRKQAVILMHDDRSIRSAVGIRGRGGATVTVSHPAASTDALLRVRSSGSLEVGESLWVGQPATSHLDYTDAATRCRIRFDETTGRIAKVVPR